MRIILKQTFPLGRFHATPWKAFTFDDPHGEWPPSPWRLVRAVLARSFQHAREAGGANGEAQASLARALCASDCSWRLPPFSWRGPGLQQYQPSEFKKIPAAAKEPGEKTYNTTKVKDNFWLAGDPLHWIIEGADDLWTEDILASLDAALDRMTYFGRAESITRIERMKKDSETIHANCVLSDSRSARSVPVLCPCMNAALAQVTCTSDEPVVANSTTPPGSVWRYADRPAVPRTKPTTRAGMATRPGTSLLQFAVGGRVLPPQKSWIRVTEKFRGIILRKLAEYEAGDRSARFCDLPPETQAKYALLTGKASAVAPLSGHRHAVFLLLPDENGVPSRLVCWRKEPFTPKEQDAILSAAEVPLAWEYGSDEWRLRLVPLSAKTPFIHDIFAASAVFDSLTPYVPSRHILNAKGKTKPGCSLAVQINTELVALGLPAATVEVLDDPAQPPVWIKVHLPRDQRRRQTNEDKRAHYIRLTFPEPVSGPLCLGHSSHFGLGLFAAVPPLGE